MRSDENDAVLHGVILGGTHSMCPTDDYYDVAESKLIDVGCNVVVDGTTAQRDNGSTV